ncbi:RNA polymerase II holoenzyme cyclin-like subunit [Malassezia caprae]|uniref:RNA polymerase II holoenzyme cyclin-like subunit n=1 Tax=Malassezia caprae TaxID=1381934 RepID=A0AAF0E6W5_9BASI|nr:RNA polymerase II holoenzyme cyclin-like subunit [Malassezia caprae]
MAPVKSLHLRGRFWTRLHGVMATNYWESSQCKRWLLRHSDIEAARDDDLMTMLGQRLQARQRVIATSAVYFQRFYSKNSYASTDPILVLVTCMYLASKVEEAPVRIRVLCAEASRMMQELGYQELPNQISTVAEMEFYLLEELEFDLVVFHPYDTLMSLCGACVDYIKVDASRRSEVQAALLQMSWYIVNDMYRSSLPLEQPPYVLAVAALYLALVAVLPTAHEIQTLVQSTAPKDGTLVDFLAGMNVSLPIVADTVQDMLLRYDLWRQLSHTPRGGLDMLHDHAAMFQRLYHMRKAYCQMLLTRSVVEDTTDRDLRPY